MNKVDAWQKLKFNIMFVGDDWHDTPKWNLIEEDLKKQDVKIVYFPYTKGTSSTLVNQTLVNLRDDMDIK